MASPVNSRPISPRSPAKATDKSRKAGDIPPSKPKKVNQPGGRAVGLGGNSLISCHFCDIKGINSRVFCFRVGFGPACVGAASNRGSALVLWTSGGV